MLGLDIIKISRMSRLIERFGDKGLKRFLCNDEILLVKSDKTAAGFWAVKEAFSKALGTGIGKEWSFHDIRIYKTSKGAPKIALRKKLIENFSILEVTLSITHDGDYAIGGVTIELEKSAAANKVQEF